MAQIFVSHSRRDDDGVNLVSKAAAGTSVKLYLAEFEDRIGVDVSAEELEREIDNSKAAFIALCEHVESIPHTRDWVLWEAGCAKGKDIWVFERAGVRPSWVVIPKFNHYVLYYDTVEWIRYVRRIIDSYKWMETVPALASGATIGLAWGPVGSAIGTAAGLVASIPSWSRPAGSRYKCPECGRGASIHFAQGTSHSRCPACNAVIRWTWEERQG